MRLAAKSALGIDVTILENYKHPFNLHSDQILNYNLRINPTRQGQYHIEEFTISPNESLGTIDENLSLENLQEIDIEHIHLLKTATDNLKPVNSIMNLSLKQGDVNLIDVKSNFASSEFTQVTQFVTGNTQIPWPQTDESKNQYDSIYWIEKGVEKESVRNMGDQQQHYQGFYKPASIVGRSANGQLSFKAGTLDNETSLIKKYSSLKGIPNTATFEAQNALAPYPDTLTVTRQNSETNTNFINHIYPADYLNLPNVPTLTYNPNRFWISNFDLAPNYEYLEIDLGETQAINFLIFQMLSAPVDIKIEYADYTKDVSIPSITSVSCNLTPGNTEYTYTLSANHDLTIGDSVTVENILNVKSYNGTFVVTDVTNNTFKVQGSSANLQSITGSNVASAKICRNFKSYELVNFDPLYPIETSIDYDADKLNKWTSLPYIFDMVFGRFIKITFTRTNQTYLRQNSFLVDETKNPPEANKWPVVVKNLRIGRNIV